LRNKIISYENENNSLDNEISNIIEDIATFDGRIMDAHNQIKKLQADIAESGALCEKYKS
jgi:peptidoglycan hydrolase CwlO-like protein